MYNNINCITCPYGKEDFDRRMTCYNKVIEEKGIPNDIYHSLQPEEAENELGQFLWCDKVGGKIYSFGHCEDAYIEPSQEENYRKRKRRTKRERGLKYKSHLKFLAKNIKKYPSPAMYVDEVFVGGYGYIENLKPYYKRLYIDSRGHKSSFYKKISNHKIRRYKGELQYGCSYKKVYDYKWNII